MYSSSRWWLPRQEPELDNLVEWLDTYTPYRGHNREFGVLGGLIGGILGLAGAASGVAMGVFRIDASLDPGVYLLIGGWAIVSIALASLLVSRKRSPAQRQAVRAIAQSRNFIWQLVSARYSGSLGKMLGEDRAMVLNAGASAYIRAKHALNHPAWKSVAPDAEFAATRERTEIAIEVAMARLVTIIGQGQDSSFREVSYLVRDMTDAADEAGRAAERLARDSGQPGDASENLRQVLAEMRLLNSAQDEINQLRDRTL